MIFKHLASIVPIMMKCDLEFISNRKLGGTDDTFNPLYKSLAFKIISYVRHLYFNMCFLTRPICFLAMTCKLLFILKKLALVWCEEVEIGS